MGKNTQENNTSIEKEKAVIAETIGNILEKTGLSDFFTLRDIIPGAGELTGLPETDGSFSTESQQRILSEIRKHINSIIGNLLAGSVSSGDNMLQEMSDSSKQENTDEDDSLTPEILKYFVKDSSEQLEEMEYTLVSIQKEPDNIENIRKAMRLLHTFKGNSSLISYKGLEVISHKAETVLDAARSGKIPLAEGSVKTLLRAVDFCKKCVAGINIENMTFSGGDEKIRTEINAELDNLISGGPSESEKQPAPEGESGPDEPGIDSEAPKTDLRINLKKVDSLLELVSELTLAEVSVTNNPDINALQNNMVGRALHHLSQVVNDIQNVSLSMRMIPLAGTFRKLHRLVFDLSLKFNKNVDLVTKGEDTEIDRNVLEQIGDPLVHIIRNSIDHGMEPQDVRLAAGKKANGTITIEGLHKNGEVHLIIQDDGKGLDREKIIAKAIQNGIVAGNEGLSDEEVYNLIFVPGFSTSDNVTEISGRGIGMDIVKRNLARINGQVEVVSSPGEYTRFVLRMPLTMAILEGMNIRIGRQNFLVPISAIKETVSVSRSAITRMPDGNETVKVRNSIMPVIHLHDYFEIETEVTAIDQGILMIVESTGKDYGFLADSIIEKQKTVVKSLPDYIGRINGILGVTIQGNGRIYPILDLVEIINSSLLKI